MCVCYAGCFALALGLVGPSGFLCVLQSWIIDWTREADQRASPLVVCSSFARAVSLFSTEENDHPLARSVLWCWGWKLRFAFWQKEEDKTHCERENPFRVFSLPLAPAADDATQDRDQVLGQERRLIERAGETAI